MKFSMTDKKKVTY